MYYCYWLRAQAQAICDFMGLGKPAPDSFTFNQGDRSSDLSLNIGPKVPAVYITCEKDLGSDFPNPEVCPNNLVIRVDGKT